MNVLSHGPRSNRRSPVTEMRRPLLWACLIVVATGCRASLQLEPSDHETVLAEQLLPGPSPSSPGPYDVRTLTYGHGDDTRRPEYADAVAFSTETVDASKLVSFGNRSDSRTDYWGFSPTEFPLNGRVWYPDGEGPFPLVLVVHGNHNERDFSDPGYDYLGELLASRGYILASIDMNFVNGVQGENDARGWLLLKHLEAWKGFNADDSNPFAGKVDMGNLALIGHSRGGEAVGHAAAFNRLSHYPDNANLTFDFNFDIKAIIAIAPVDGQYLPTDRHVPVENVDYMVFHGSHDGDVTSFHGLRLYQRVQFTDDLPHLKTAIYVYRANHGQWNTTWGAGDRGPRSARSLDLRGLLDPEDQQEFAKIYVSAFLDQSLRGDGRYLPLFRDHRVAGGWLPETMYVTQFQDGTFLPLATFEEDIDVTSGSTKGVGLMGDSLSTWRERDLALRSRNRANTSASQVNQAVWLGWNREVRGSEDLGRPATFTISVPDTLGAAWGVGASASLQLSLAATDDEPGPRAAADTTGSQDGPNEATDNQDGLEETGGRTDGADGPSSNADAGTASVGDEGDEEDTDEPINLSIEVVDSRGRSAKVTLGNYGPIRRPLETRILRRADQEEDRFDELYELVLQTFSIPLSDFTRVDPALDLRTLAEIRLVFDLSEAGTVVLDDVGIAFLDDAYTAVRVPSDN
jgi:dienelactone hydrolase